MSAVIKNQLITIDSLRIQSTPAILVGNFQELNAWLDARLAEKVTVVTEETIKEEKSLVAELRKIEKAFAAKEKEIIAAVAGDIDGFKSSMKDLRNKIIKVADDKAAQVTNLENITRGEIAAQLKALLEHFWEINEIKAEFRKASVDDLVKLTSRTSKGNLTAAATDTVYNRVQADAAQQGKIENRLMALENQSMKAGISMLERQHVESFLYADDYDQRLAALIESEIRRKAEAEERIRKQIEAEQARKVEAELAKQRAELEAQKKAELEAQRAQIEAEQREANARAYQAEKLAQQERLQKEADSFVVEASAQASRIAQQAKEEADNVALAARNEAARIQELKLNLERYESMYSRYPDSDTAKLIHETKRQLGMVEEAKPAPEGSVVYRVKVEYKKEHVFEFTSRPNADKTKIKDYFWAKALRDFGINDDDILSLEVS